MGNNSSEMGSSFSRVSSEGTLCSYVCSSTGGGLAFKFYSKRKMFTILASLLHNVNLKI